MTVQPTADKCTSLVELCKRTGTRSEIRIESVASITGKIVSMFPGAQFGPLHYRELEKGKSSGLEIEQGQLEGKNDFEYRAQTELKLFMEVGQPSKLY